MFDNEKVGQLQAQALVDDLNTMGVTDGGDLLLTAIAATVIGGTSLFGGRGSTWSALLGALVIGSITNSMDLLAHSSSIKS